MIVIHVYNELLAARNCLERVRTFYPEEKVLLVNDFDFLDYSPLANEFNLTYLEHSSRMRLPEYGGLWTDFYFQQYLELTSQKDYYLMKIDPDTKVIKRFEPPKNFKVLGSYNPKTKVPYGGCLIFHRDIVRLIVNSEILKDPCYTEQAYCYQRNGELLNFQDLILVKVFEKLGIDIEERKEILCRPGRVRTIHPHTAIYHK